MCRIPYIRVIFQQWPTISCESFTNKIEPSGIEPSEEDADTLESDYCTDVKFERQVGVNGYSKIRDERKKHCQEEFRLISIDSDYCVVRVACAAVASMSTLTGNGFISRML
jgi:hypothetical protein